MTGDEKNLLTSKSDAIEREIAEISAIAKREGVELDEGEARQWIIAMSNAERESALMQDAETGVFGHRVSLMDFNKRDVDYFRRLAHKTRMVAHPQVESVIAIAGSAAQGRVQLFPGDNDFFERVNIRAKTEAEARRILGEIVRQTALRAFKEPDIVLVDVDLGVYPFDVISKGKRRQAGHTIEWTPTEVLDGYKTVQDEHGNVVTIQWEDINAGAGFIYLGWIVADRKEGRIGLASNVLDATWETPDGKIIALDGALDPFFQEIYLEPSEMPIFRKITKNAETSKLEGYVAIMRQQVIHYAHEEVNYGKVAKRLYNLFRLTDQLEAAAYVRELFDEPGARMYQVPGLLEAADVARDPESGIDRATVINQIDLIIRSVIEVGVGGVEADLVMELIRLRDNVRSEGEPDHEWKDVLGDVTEKCLAFINDYFRERLFALPQIEKFVASLPS